MAESTDTETITFRMAVAQVRTLADGGIRVTIDLPETAVYEAAWFMEVRRDEVEIETTCRRKP